jgi:hypothetical protein
VALAEVKTQEVWGNTGHGCQRNNEIKLTGQNVTPAHMVQRQVLHSHACSGRW